MSSFFRSLLGHRNQRGGLNQREAQAHALTFRDFTITASSMLNGMMKQAIKKVLSPEDIKHKYFEQKLHKHTVPFKEGRLVLLWKERTTHEEYLDYLKKTTEQRTVSPEYVVLKNPITGSKYGYVDVVSPFIVSDVKDSAYDGFKNSDMDLTEMKKIKLEFQQSFLSLGENLSISEENFYFVYEGVGKLRISENQTRTLQRLGISKYTDFYTVQFKTDSDGRMFARTEEAYSFLFIKNRDTIEELLMFKLWLFSIHGFGLNSLWMFSLLIFYYSSSTVLLFILAFMIFKDVVKNKEYASVSRRRYQAQEVASRRNLDNLFKEMVYVGTQELVH